MKALFKKKNKKIEALLSTKDFLNNWPSLKTPLGYDLETDFQAWYPQASELTEEKLYELIYKLSIRRSRCTQKNQLPHKAEVDQLKTINHSNTTEKNTKFASEIKLLAYLLPSTGRANAKHHTTVIDIFESMILYAQVF